MANLLLLWFYGTLLRTAIQTAPSKNLPVLW